MSEAVPPFHEDVRRIVFGMIDRRLGRGDQSGDLAAFQFVQAQAGATGVGGHGNSEVSIVVCLRVVTALSATAIGPVLTPLTCKAKSPRKVSQIERTGCISP